MTKIAPRFSSTGDVTLFAGETFIVELAIKQTEAGDPLDLTDRTFVMTAYEARTGTVVQSVTADAESDAVILSFLGEDTTALFEAASATPLRLQLVEVVENGTAILSDGALYVRRSPALTPEESPPVATTASPYLSVTVIHATNEVNFVERGAPATITIGTVTPLNPGATPTVENSGTPAAAVLDFGIPSLAGMNFTTGDMLVASGAAALAKLAAVAVGSVLLSGGIGASPAWGKVGLTTHISGTLGVDHGGTGQTTAAAAIEALMPAYAGNANKRLGLNSAGTALEWVTDGGGTVTSVSALTLGTTGTDLSSSVANAASTPVITLNVPNASASNRGALTAADWTTFNAKQAALVSGTNIKTVGGVSLLGSGDLGTIGAGYGGTGLSSFTVGDILYASGASALSKLAAVATGNVLLSGGIGTAPAWGQVGLTTHVSGTLPVANGGTGVTSSTGSGSNVLSNSPTLVTPALGTPSAAVLTNATGLPLTTGVTGTLATDKGGTGLGGATPFTANGIVYASSASALATSSNLTWNGSQFVFNGKLGVSTTALTGYGQRHELVINDASGAYGAAYRYLLGNTVTTFFNVFSKPSLQNNTAIGDLIQYAVDHPTLGTGASVTNQYGYYVPGSFYTATNNYAVFLGNSAATPSGKVFRGIYSQVNAATAGGTVWNLYFEGNAPSYVAGDLRIGGTAAGASKLVVFDNSIQLTTAKTPSSASDTGSTGQIAWDSSYIYVCTGSNAWKRAALSTW